MPGVLSLTKMATLGILVILVTRVPPCKGPRPKQKQDIRPVLTVPGIGRLSNGRLVMSVKLMDRGRTQWYRYHCGCLFITYYDGKKKQTGKEDSYMFPYSDDFLQRKTDSAITLLSADPPPPGASYARVELADIGVTTDYLSLPPP